MSGIVGGMLSRTDSELLVWRRDLEALEVNEGGGWPVVIVEGAMTKEEPGQIRRGMYRGRHKKSNVARVELYSTRQCVHIAFDRIWPCEELIALEQLALSNRRKHAAETSSPAAERFNGVGD